MYTPIYVHALIQNETQYNLCTASIGNHVVSQRHTLDEEAVEEEEDEGVPPSVKDHPLKIVTEEGLQMELAIQVSGYPTPTIEWYKDGELVESDYSCEVYDNGTITFFCIETRHKGDYLYFVSNCHGSVEGNVSVVVGVDETETAAIGVEDFGSYVAQCHSNSNVKFVTQFQVSSC